MLADPSFCQVTYECISVIGSDPDMNCSDDRLNFDSNNGDTSFKTFDMQKYKPGSYVFTVRASVGSEVAISTEFTFNFTLVDPCPTSTL